MDRHYLLRLSISSQRGSSTVLVCLALVALIGVSALAIDAGMMYATRIQIQNAADAAVLAGVRELPGNPSKAIQVASQYAQLNSLQDNEIVFTVSADNRSIKGVASRSLALLFAPIFGVNNQLLTAQATARVSPLSGCKGVVPFGVADDAYSFGDTKVIKYAASFDNPLPPGQFAPLSLGSPGASTYADNISFGYNSLIKVGAVLPVETGNMIGPTRQGIDNRVSGCTHSPACTITSFKNGCPRILIVPMGHNSPEPGSNGKFTVTGFAAFLVTDVPTNGHNGELIGTFVRYVILGESGAESNDRGAYIASLVE